MRLIRGLVRRLRREEDGVVLVIAIATMAVLALTTTGILVAGTTNQREAYVADQERQAFAIAQEGLAYAEGMVYAAGVAGTSPPSGSQSLPAQPVGSGRYYASVEADGSTWDLTGTGTVGNYTRSVTAQEVPPSSTSVTESGVWNYVYSDSVSSCMSISGGVSVSVPILSRGNICIVGGSHFVNPGASSTATLIAGGTVTDTGGSNIGTSSSPVAAVEAAGCTAWSGSTCTSSTTTSCTIQQSTIVNVVPGTGVCNGLQSPLYAKKVSSTLDITPQMPCIGQSSTLNPQCPSSTASWSTLNSVYNTEKNATQTGCPANLLDDSAWTLNNSVSASTLTSAMFNKTTGYDCKVTSGGTTIGEIKWTPGSSCGSGTLVVSGTLYFDGSLDYKCGWKVTYSGQATLYFTGTITQEGGTTLCGIANCTASWNPDVNGIIFVAGCWTNSTGSTLAASKCVYITGGSTAQWGAYATTAYQIDGGSGNYGPVLANTTTIGGGSATLIPFHVFPPGTPLGTETVEIPATAPKFWAG